MGIWCLVAWYLAATLRPVEGVNAPPVIGWVLICTAVIEAVVVLIFRYRVFTPQRLVTKVEKESPEKSAAAAVLSTDTVLWAIAASIPLYGLFGVLLGAMSEEFHILPIMALGLIFFTRRDSQDFDNMIQEILKDYYSRNEHSD